MTQELRRCPNCGAKQLKQKPDAEKSVKFFFTEPALHGRSVHSRLFAVVLVTRRANGLKQSPEGPYSPYRR